MDLQTIMKANIEIPLDVKKRAGEETGHEKSQKIFE